MITTDIAASNAGAVIVGVDGSASSGHALRWAANQASLEGRPLLIVHATGSPWGDVEGLDAGNVAAALVTAGTAVLDDTVDEVSGMFPSLDVRASLIRGLDPRNALLSVSEDGALLVVGARGRGPVARLVLGSVSAAVARHAPCPVVVVRPLEPDVVRHGVLVGVDADGRSRHTLEFAFRLASQRSLPLTVMHCFLDLTVTTPGACEIPYDTVGFEDRRRILDEAVEGLPEKFPDVSLRLVIGRGLVEECLEATAERMDVVVVGSHHSSLVTTLFDRHTDRSLVTHAAAVVAVVPEPGPRPHA